MNIRLMHVATGLLVLLLVGHTLGTVSTQSRGPEEAAALAALAAVRFDVMGVTRSHADFYAGLGWSLSAAVVGFVWTSIVTTRLIRDRVGAGRVLAYGLATATALLSIVSWIWIFPVPAVITMLAALCYLVVATRS